MTDNALEITGLRKTYAATKRTAAKDALNGVDLCVPRGSIFGLLGPNGAGKSTLINILAGLVTKTEGRVRIWGFDQDVNPRQSRASIGVMSAKQYSKARQRLGLMPHRRAMMAIPILGLARPDDVRLRHRSSRSLTSRRRCCAGVSDLLLWGRVLSGILTSLPCWVAVRARSGGLFSWSHTLPDGGGARHNLALALPRDALSIRPARLRQHLQPVHSPRPAVGRGCGR